MNFHGESENSHLRRAPDATINLTVQLCHSLVRSPLVRPMLAAVAGTPVKYIDE